MRRKIKIALTLFVLLVSFSLLYFPLFNEGSQRSSIVGKVIEFSEVQESSGNVISMIILSFSIMGIVIIFSFINYLDNYYQRKANKEEIDRMIGQGM